MRHDPLAWRDAHLERADLFCWRASISEEVDFVSETGGPLLPIAIKTAARPPR